MEKRKMSLPLKQCSFGIRCSSVDVGHFSQYSHQHLNSILEMGIDVVTGGYVIPDECVVAQSCISQQLAILRESRAEGEKSEKVQKIERNGVLSPCLEGTSCTDKTQKSSVVSSQSLVDFFKERRQAFASKDPELMRAQSTNTLEMFPVIPHRLQLFFPLVLPLRRMAEKLKQAAPYNMFLTAVTESVPTHNNSGFVTFLDLLDISLGELESSVQINFTVSLEWLMAQYTVAKVNHLPLIILYGQEDIDLHNANKLIPNVTSFMIQVPANFGCHHAKVMLFFYKDKSMRVVVSTANLYHDDWDNRVQGLWVSDRLPGMSSSSTDGESVTSFRADLIHYLENYQISTLQPYIDRVKNSDFSSVKVFLITSVPGPHKGDTYGHPRLGSLLKQHSAPIDVKHSIIMQSSSLGNYGDSAAAFLTGEVTRSFKMSSEPLHVQASPTVKLIYPSLKNVDNSHDGISGGGCLPYHQSAHDRQPWLNQFLYQWKSESRNCDRAMPHIKSYCRYSDEGMFWFALTSHNMSKSAWGVTKKVNQREWALHINSYEAGVVFFPRIILGQDTFPMNEAQQSNAAPIFKLPYDLPPVPYLPDDVPFCIQYLLNMHSRRT